MIEALRLFFSLADESPKRTIGRYVGPTYLLFEKAIFQIKFRAARLLVDEKFGFESIAARRHSLHSTSAAPPLAQKGRPSSMSDRVLEEKKHFKSFYRARDGWAARFHSTFSY